MDFESYFEPKNLKGIWNGSGKYVLFGVVAIVVLAGILSGGTPQTVSAQGTSVSSPSNVFSLDVINVDPVIARQFNSPIAAGALVNQVMTGMSGRLVDLRRGDIILKLNNIPVQSVNHLQYLMTQKQPGDTLTFEVVRKGSVKAVSTRIPKFAAPMDLYNPSTRNMTVAIAILALTFIVFFFNLVHRTVGMVLSAVLMLTAGSLMGFYDQAKAFQSIEMEPLLILVGMGIFPVYLQKANFFEYCAKKIMLAMKGDTVKTAVILCVMTYVLSLFVNNYATILIMIPITLYVSRGLQLDPTPIAIAQVIAAVIGGTSTMIGNFSNMLIGASTGLSFLDFLIYMMPICLVFLFVLLWYMKQFEFSKLPEHKSPVLRQAFLKQIQQDMRGIQVDWPLVRLTLTVLVSVIVAMIILPFWRIEAATIALAGGFILLLLGKQDIGAVLTKTNITDILFLIGLFIVVGGAQHAGVLKGISNLITTLSMGSGLLYLLLLMLGITLCTIFMNSGPATAFFIPILMHGRYAAFNDTVWWAIGLGALAGSCVSLTGDMASLITPTVLEDSHRHATGKETQQFKLFTSQFGKTGLPLAVIFLALSSVYLSLLVIFQGIK